MKKDKISQTTEGTTTVFIYDNKTLKKGPGCKQGVPFYNPTMELNRDCSIGVAQWFLNMQKNQLHFLDGLSASGIRGVRFLNELNGEFEVTINDWSKAAYELIKKNVRLVQQSNSRVTNENIHTLLTKGHYDYIDIDPFGSPAEYIDSAIRGCKHHGIIACTATDTATLCGTYRKVCRRRYSAIPYHSVVMHEIGLRILLGFLGREACKHDKGITPILAYSTDHYMRVYIQLHNNINTANETTEMIGTISSSEIYPFSQGKKQVIGPLWTGRLHNKEAVKKIRSEVMAKTLGTKNSLIRLLNLLEDESVAPMFFYTSDSIASRLKCSPPSINDLFEKIESAGYKICRTHFNHSGFKTLAPVSLIEKIFLELQ